MNTLKTTAATFISGLLPGTALVSARSASANETTMVSANALHVSSTYLAPAALVEQLVSRTADANTGQSNNCRPGHMYTAHDRASDPESCIMQGATWEA